MTDGQWLLGIFAGFYLLECLHWLPLGCAVLRSSWRSGGWSAGVPSAQFAAQGSGLSIAWPLPLLGDFLVAQPWPVLPDGEGVIVGEHHVRAGERVAWAEVKPRVEMSEIELKPGLKIRCASRRAAVGLTDFLVKARDLSASKRCQFVETWWQASLSLPKARAAVRRYRIGARALRFSCVFAFVLCFGYLPALFWFSGGGFRVLVGFGSLLLLNMLIALTWRGVDRRLHPEDQSRRWAQVLHLIFMPAHTIRAHDLVGVDALLGVHPLAASGAMLGEQERVVFAQQLWRRWKYVGASDRMRTAVPLVLPKIEACCASMGLQVSDLDVLPERLANAASFCPQCQTAFDAAHAVCDTCLGVETRAW